jgi:hypothetical protein
MLIAEISDGLLNRFSTAFQPAFWTFLKTSASIAFEPGAWPQDLLVTSDFANTVLLADTELLDQYLRPVHWIVSIQSRNTVSCVIISPHEANELMPIVRRNQKVTRKSSFLEDHFPSSGVLRAVTPWIYLGSKQFVKHYLNSKINLLCNTNPEFGVQYTFIGLV